MNIVRQYIKTILNEVGLTAREINAYGSRRYEIFLNLDYNLVIINKNIKNVSG